MMDNLDQSVVVSEGDAVNLTSGDHVDPSSSRDWPLVKRIVFRFVCAFLILYNLQITLALLPWLGFLSAGFGDAIRVIVPWVAKTVFHCSGMAVTYFRTGSGDTTLSYVEFFCFLVLAIVATIIWSLIDAKRKNYTALHAWLRLYTRYILAYWMFSYGFAKLIPPTQFPTPYLARLLERYGDFSPMGLLWTFMGYSRTYTYCCGIAEAAGGMLLLFKRTTTLGALVSGLCMANVLLLNLSYDVPVKLFSATLLLMAVFLSAPEIRRLVNFFVLNRPAVAENMGPTLPRAPRMRIATTVLKSAVIAYLIYQTTLATYKQNQKYMTAAAKPPIQGIYDVEEFVRGGQVVQPLTTDAARWRAVVIQNYIGSNGATVRMMDDSLVRYHAEFDVPKATMTLTSGTDKNKKQSFTYTSIDANHVLLQGSLDKEPVAIKLRRIDESKFLIVSRGFHWITELSFNR